MIAEFVSTRYSSEKHEIKLEAPSLGLASGENTFENTFKDAFEKDAF